MRRKITIDSVLRWTLPVCLLSTLMACGSFEYVGNSNDGIYGEEPQYTETNRRVAASSDANSDYYSNYFKEKSDQWNNVPTDSIFTDVDSYSSQYGVENDSLMQYNNYSGWGQNATDVSINIYDNSFNRFLWNRPFYSTWDFHFGFAPYGWGWGFNNWGWGFNNWGWGLNRWGWGFNNWGWGFNNWGWGFNNWGVWHPYYAGHGWNYPYGYRSNRVAYSGSRRGSRYTGSNLGVQGRRVNSGGRSAITSRNFDSSRRLRSSIDRFSSNVRRESIGSNSRVRSGYRTNGINANRNFRTNRGTRSGSGTFSRNNGSSRRNLGNRNSSGLNRASGMSRSSGSSRSMGSPSRASGSRSSGARSSGSRSGSRRNN